MKSWGKTKHESARCWTGARREKENKKRWKNNSRERTVDDLRRALERAGVEFIDENGGGAGVRLAKPKTSRKGGGKGSKG